MRLFLSVISLALVSVNSFADIYQNLSLAEIRSDITENTHGEPPDKLAALDRYINMAFAGRLASLPPTEVGEIARLRPELCRKARKDCIKSISWLKPACSMKLGESTLWRDLIPLIDSAEDLKSLLSSITACKKVEAVAGIAINLLKLPQSENPALTDEVLGNFFNNLFQAQFVRNPIKTYKIFQIVADDVLAGKPVRMDQFTILYDAALRLPSPAKNLFTKATAEDFRILNNYFQFLSGFMVLIGKSDAYLSFIQSHGPTFSLSNPIILAESFRPLCELEMFKGKFSDCRVRIKSASQILAQDQKFQSDLAFINATLARYEGRFKESEQLYLRVSKPASGQPNWASIGLAYLYRHHPRPDHFQMALNQLQIFKLSWGKNPPNLAASIFYGLELEILLRRGELASARAKTDEIKKFVSERFQGEFSQTLWNDYYDLVVTALEHNRPEVLKLQSRIQAAAKRNSYYSVLEQLAAVIVLAEANSPVDRQLEALSKQMGPFHSDFLTLKSFVEVLQKQKSAPH